MDFDSHLYIGNLKPEVAHEDIKLLLSQFGEVHGVFIIPGCNWALAKMINEEDAWNAMKELHGQLLQGRKLVIRKAEKGKGRKKQKPNATTQQNVGVPKEPQTALPNKPKPTTPNKPMPDAKNEKAQTPQAPKPSPAPPQKNPKDNPGWSMSRKRGVSSQRSLVLGHPPEFLGQYEDGKE